MVNSGLFTTEQALHKAVRDIEKGVPIVTYRNTKTGMQTVQNKVDVAIRRHIRTQIAQDGARMTLKRLDDMEVPLVEVSSHCGSRPSHAEWQGRCYSLRGDVVIDGVKYPDFYSATHYGSVDGLLGANCRHSFGPYRHGMPRAYENDPEHPSGLSNDEIYELEQKQRYLECKIRDDKRDLRGAKLEYQGEPTTDNKLNVAKAQKRLKDRQAQMRKLIDDANAKAKDGVKVLHRNPRREWAGDMPENVKVKSSHRKLDDFLASRAKRPEKVEQDNTAKQALNRKTLLPIEARRKEFKPVNPAFFAARRKEIEKEGGMIWQDSEATRYLNNRNADAATLGEVIVLRENATLSEVLEEEFHFHQNLRGDYAEYPEEEIPLRKEIDAQRYLLDVANRYKIPRIETEQTKAALQFYLTQLEELIHENH